MKQTSWIRLALILVIPMFIFAVSCSKEKISSDAYTPSAADAEAQRKADERARQDSKAIGEEDLKEGALSEEMQAERMKIERETFENEDIHFEFDSIRLTPQAQQILNKKAEWLRANPNASVTIEGHCDERGTNEYNLALGDGRALSAKKYLLDLGIEPTRLKAVSYGEERPIDPTSTEEAWAKNRRAHFVIER
jgi:peptidoglycan-associated lipoprotein